MLEAPVLGFIFLITTLQYQDADSAILEATTRGYLEDKGLNPETTAAIAYFLSAMSGGKKFGKGTTPPRGKQQASVKEKDGKSKTETSSAGNATNERQTNDVPWKIPDDVAAKFPKGVNIVPNSQGKAGFRWWDGKGNGVRVDQGNPASQFPTQQVDHVIVNSGGKVIGRDGKPISGSIKSDPENAHIPLSEYKNWRTWNKP